MSNDSVNAALRRLGYGSDDQTGHGFRSMASTLRNEQGFPPQLTHSERNKVRADYNRAQHQEDDAGVGALCSLGLGLRRTAGLSRSTGYRRRRRHATPAHRGRRVYALTSFNRRRIK